MNHLARIRLMETKALAKLLGIFKCENSKIPPLIEISKLKIDLLKIVTIRISVTVCLIIKHLK